MKKTLHVVLAVILAFAMIGGFAFVATPTSSGEYQISLASVKAVDVQDSTVGVRSYSDLVETTRMYQVNDVIYIAVTAEVKNIESSGNRSLTSISGKEIDVVVGSSNVDLSYAKYSSPVLLAHIWSGYSQANVATLGYVMSAGEVLTYDSATNEVTWTYKGYDQYAMTTTSTSVNLNLVVFNPSVDSDGNIMIPALKLKKQEATWQLGTSTFNTTYEAPTSVAYTMVLTGVTKANDGATTGSFYAKILVSGAEKFEDFKTYYVVSDTGEWTETVPSGTEYVDYVAVEVEYLEMTSGYNVYKYFVPGYATSTSTPIVYFGDDDDYDEKTLANVNPNLYDNATNKTTFTAAGLSGTTELSVAGGVKTQDKVYEYYTTSSNQLTVPLSSVVYTTYNKYYAPGFYGGTYTSTSQGSQLGELSTTKIADDLSSVSVSGTRTGVTEYVLNIRAEERAAFNVHNIKFYAAGQLLVNQADVNVNNQVANNNSESALASPSYAADAAAGTSGVVYSDNTLSSGSLTGLYDEYFYDDSLSTPGPTSAATSGSTDLVPSSWSTLTDGATPGASDETSYYVMNTPYVPTGGSNSSAWYGVDPGTNGGFTYTVDYVINASGGYTVTVHVTDTSVEVDPLTSAPTTTAELANQYVLFYETSDSNSYVTLTDLPNYPATQWVGFNYSGSGSTSGIAAPIATLLVQESVTNTSQLISEGSLTDAIYYPVFSEVVGSLDNPISGVGLQVSNLNWDTGTYLTMQDLYAKADITNIYYGLVDSSGSDLLGYELSTLPSTSGGRRNVYDATGGIDNVKTLKGATASPIAGDLAFTNIDISADSNGRPVVSLNGLYVYNSAGKWQLISSSSSTIAREIFSASGYGTYLGTAIKLSLTVNGVTGYVGTWSGGAGLDEYVIGRNGIATYVICTTDDEPLVALATESTYFESDNGYGIAMFDAHNLDNLATRVFRANSTNLTYTGTGTYVTNSSAMIRGLNYFGLDSSFGTTYKVLDDDFESKAGAAVYSENLTGSFKYGTISEIEIEGLDEDTPITEVEEDEDVDVEDEVEEEDIPEETPEPTTQPSTRVPSTGDASVNVAFVLAVAAVIAAAGLVFVMKKVR